jgi:hypothetical protein
LEEDIEGLKARVKNKENNAYFIEVNKFFGDVKNSIEMQKQEF